MTVIQKVGLDILSDPQVVEAFRLLTLALVAAIASKIGSASLSSFVRLLFRGTTSVLERGIVRKERSAGALLTDARESLVTTKKEAAAKKTVPVSYVPVDFAPYFGSSTGLLTAAGFVTAPEASWSGMRPDPLKLKPGDSLRFVQNTSSANVADGNSSRLARTGDVVTFQEMSGEYLQYVIRPGKTNVVRVEDVVLA